MRNDDIQAPLQSLLNLSLSIHHLNRRVERSLGVSLVQWFLLSRLRDLPSVPALRLARAIGIHPSTLTPALKRLQKRELIAIRTDSRDSRRKLVSLARAGKELLDRTEGKMGDWSKALNALDGELRAASAAVVGIPIA